MHPIVESASGADRPPQEDNTPSEHFRFQPYRRIRFPLRGCLSLSLSISLTHFRSLLLSLFLPLLAALGFLHLRDNYVRDPYSILSVNVSNSPFYLPHSLPLFLSLSLSSLSLSCSNHEHVDFVYREFSFLYGDLCEKKIWNVSCFLFKFIRLIGFNVVPIIEIRFY